MQAFSDTLKKSWARFLKILGGAPRYYWGYVLIFGFLLLVAVFVLDTAVFMNMRDSAFGEINLSANIGVKSVDRAALNAATEIIAGREKRLGVALKALVPQDPGR